MSFLRLLYVRGHAEVRCERCSVVPPLCPGTWPGNTAGTVTFPCQVPGGMEQIRKTGIFFSVNERLRGGVGVIHLFKIGKQTLSSCNYIEFLFRVVHGATGPPDIAMMG